MKNIQISFLIVCILFCSSVIAFAQPSISSTSPLPLSDVDVTDMISQITEPMVYDYHDGLMRFGARYTGSINSTLAAQYIYDEFEDMGLDTSFHEWKYDGFTSRNVVAMQL